MDEPTRADAAPALSHFTLVADGVLGRFVPGHDCQPGPAMMGLKVWAASGQHAAQVAQQVGRHVGFAVSGRCEVYKTAPARPCGDQPFGYDLQLTPYDADPAPAGPPDAEPGAAAAAGRPTDPS